MCHFLGSSPHNFYHGSRLTNSTDKTLCSGIPVCNSCLSSIYENNAFPSSSSFTQWNRKRWTGKIVSTQIFLGKEKLYDEKMVKFQRWGFSKLSKLSFFLINRRKKEVLDKEMDKKKIIVDSELGIFRTLFRRWRRERCSTVSKAATKDSRTASWECKSIAPVTVHGGFYRILPPQPPGKFLLLSSLGKLKNTRWIPPPNPPSRTW